MQIQVLRSRLAGPGPALPLERRRLGGPGRGESLGTVLLRGLVFRLLNIRKTTSKSDSLCRDNVNNCFETGARCLHPCLWVLLCFYSGWWQGLPDGWVTRPSRNCQLHAHQVQVPLRGGRQVRSSRLCPVFLAKSTKKPLERKGGFIWGHKH